MSSFFPDDVFTDTKLLPRLQLQLEWINIVVGGSVAPPTQVFNEARLASVAASLCYKGPTEGSSLWRYDAICVKEGLCV